MENEVFINLIFSGCLGALIGLVRQWQTLDEGRPEREFAGIRTFALWALLGATGGTLAMQGYDWMLPLPLVLVALHLIFNNQLTSRDHSANYTTFAAALLTYLAGAIAATGSYQWSVMLAGATALIIGLKRPIHHWSERITKTDIRHFLQFLAITGVILPLVPNQTFGPFDAFNPRNTWMMVILISGLGFLGYVLMRLLGARSGIALTGIVGGLASSTATTLAFSRQSKANPDLSAEFALAVVLACSVMVVRVGFIIFVIVPELFAVIWVALLLMTVPGLLYWLWFQLRGKLGPSDIEQPKISNPLSLSIAIKFALIYTVVNFLVKAASNMDLADGLLAVSFLSGLTDVDAISLSMANSAREGSVGFVLAAQAVVVGAIANTILKGGLALGMGSRVYRLHIAVVLGIVALTGIFGYLLVPSL